MDVVLFYKRDSQKWESLLLYCDVLELFNVFHLRCIAGLGIGLFVRIADGDDIVQFIVFGDVETVEEELCAESVSTQTIAIRLKIILFIFSQIYLQR